MLEINRHQVRLNMMARDEGFGRQHRKSLCSRMADKKASDKSGLSRRHIEIDFRKFHLRFFKSFFYTGNDVLEMRARSELRNNTSIFLVNFPLRLNRKR